MSRSRDLADLGGVTTRLDQVGNSEGALSNRNLIINGAMQVAQRGTSATVSNSSNEGYSTLDRWYLNFNNTIGGATVFSQSTDAPDGFANSLKLQCSTVDTSFTTNQYVTITHRIEAQNIQQLSYGTSGAKPMILSWRMKTETYTGPITVALETKDGTSEYYVKSYTPTTSWAEYSCVIPPSTSATINNDSGEGLRLRFVLAGDSGSSIAASSDSTSWSTTRADYRNDVGNILSNTSNAIYITGVQLEVGDTSTDFEHISYGDQLQKCQRYYYKLLKSGDGSYIPLGTAYATTDIQVAERHPITMRADPSIAISGNIRAVDGAAATISSGAAFANQSNTSTLAWYTNNNAFSGLTQFRPYLISGESSGDYFEVDAEL
tara:strand:- start:148 stop:1278 length:1131 start_codon:yes stop_codon:yes gene_type:complete